MAKAPAAARPAPVTKAAAARPAGEQPAPKAPRSPKKKKRTPAWVVVLISLFCLCLVLAGGVVMAAYRVADIDTIYPGVTTDGVEIGLRTVDEAEQLLTQRERDVYKDFAVTVSLPEGRSVTVTAEDARLNISCRDAAEAAYRVGREGNLFENLYSYIRYRWLDATADTGVGALRSVDDAALHALVHDVAEDVNADLLSSEMRVGRYSVNVVKGAVAYYIDEDTIVDYLREALLNADSTPIEYQMDMRTDEDVDLANLHKEITREAVNSVYDEALHGATPSQVGVTFDLKEAESRWAAAEYGETVAIPLIITPPETTEEQVNNLLFRDLLGEKTTSLSGSTAARIENVAKACELLSAVVLEPGEQFDYNACLGERTPDNGWLPAPAYADGEVRDEYGGGICQVSSTLFVSCLYADLQIDSRSCHYFPVGYLPAGMDATVSWGGPEYRFTNNREYPIRLKAFVSEDKRTVTIQIWGTNETGNYIKINFSGAMENFTDPSLTHADGSPVATGYNATIWCYLYAPDGTLLEGEEGDYHWFFSEYHYHTEDIQAQVGT